jgi:hypothetical protein
LAPVRGFAICYPDRTLLHDRGGCFSDFFLKLEIRLRRETFAAKESLDLFLPLFTL